MSGNRFLGVFLFWAVLFSSTGIGRVHAITAQKIKCFQKAMAINIGDHLNGSRYPHLEWGIMMATVDGQHILFQHHPDDLFIPASVIKILTSGISLLKFGPDHRFETLVMTGAPIHSRTLEGDIYIKGKGDPALTINDLRAVANSIKKDIDVIGGDVVYDRSYLENEPPRYPPNARHLYAPANALTVNYNWLPLGLDTGPPVKLWTIPKTGYARLRYQVRISDSWRPGLPRMTYKQKPWGDEYHISGTITRWDRKYKILRLCVTRPGLFAATLFKESCRDTGITVKGTVRNGKTPPGCRTIASITTRPLKEIACTLNQESNNVVAELVNKNLGAVFDSLPGTREKGLGVIKAYLKEKLNLSPGDFSIRDASGLSPKNRLSANQLVCILNHLYSRLGKGFYETLALQGVHPHARNPVPPPDIRMVVKSGTLPQTGVNAVAGYIFIDRLNMTLSFAALANRRGSGAPAYSGTFTQPILSGIIRGIGQVD